MILEHILEICNEGSQLVDWISHHQLYRLLFCHRRNNGGRGHPVRASLEWALLEEQRIYLNRFYLSQRSSPRQDLYSKVLRRSLKTLVGMFHLFICLFMFI